MQLRNTIKVAVMGCAVNGPGEAADADIGLAGGADGGLIFRHGEKVGYYAEDALFDTFIGMVKELTREDASDTMWCIIRSSYSSWAVCFRKSLTGGNAL